MLSAKAVAYQSPRSRSALGARDSADDLFDANSKRSATLANAGKVAVGLLSGTRAPRRPAAERRPVRPVQKTETSLIRYRAEMRPAFTLAVRFHTGGESVAAPLLAVIIERGRR